MLKAFLINVLPVVIAVVAIAVPTWISVRQTRISQHVNNIQAMINLLDEFRSAAFHDQHEYVCNRLQQEHDPSEGVRGLPSEAKATFCNVVYYYQSFATLTIFQLVDEDLFLPLLRHRLSDVWRATQPFVERERELRGSDSSYLSAFEELARRAAELPSTYIHDRIRGTRRNRRRWFPLWASRRRAAPDGM
ncbi:hypothetical protein QFZ55_007821 [Streptomyces luteogriseus]|uniref:DUF4760 domain-containing protein n=1 Tax=Streptomyces luteogriseus TaxID=68233 RepID=UPI0027834DD8|nr:hypothetical protein [Streptomyces luteogriseus]MDQ0718369.1 hypothetical protein [Streptomyces luteogriseus]